MLRFLRITHLAVIDQAEVEFEPGFNVLTGETGAGKSILVEAVGLLLGGRASAELVRTGEEAAAIEAIFETGGEELLVRREITAQGRSRAFVNGALATATTLRELSARLIELHGQHEHQTLLDPGTHIDLVDTFARLDAWTAPAAAAFELWRAGADELARLKRSLADRDSRRELVAFQLAELDRAGLKPAELSEDAELAARRSVLSSAERVERLCAESYAALYESDTAVLASLGGVWRRVADLAALDPGFQPYLETKDGIKSQLEDLALFLRRYADGIDASAAKLQEVEDRLAVLERVKRKYGPTLEACLVRREALGAELSDLDRGDERLAELDRECAASKGAFVAAAKRLSAERRRAATEFSRRLESVAGELAMENARVELRFDDELPESDWSVRGVDRAEFFVSTNPGEELRPLVRVVSGGELSRLMLAIKTLTAGSRLGWTDADDRPGSAATPGLVFDEVDAGIGGRVAEVVGRKLHALGSAFQVLCITHQPQIAALADAHFAIEKRVINGRTHTSVTRLDRAARVQEIGRMLGGSVTEGLRASAEELLSRRGARTGSSGAQAKGESKPKGESERAKAKGRRGA
jgi:DNA repair protein RecN (Recombination protein N)